MDADRLRAARDRGVVISDSSSRPQIANNPGEKTGGWAKFLRIRRPK